MTAPPAQPLSGTLVLDLSRMLPGAVVARTLIDLGARVIKIEVPEGGDPLRLAPPLVDGVGVAFCAFYRGAESVCLDLRSDAGVGALLSLARHAHVLLESFRPGTLERFGVPADRLLALNPGLVGCSISGFGGAVPDASPVAHDLNLVAWSGLLSLLPGSGVPRVQLADVATGLLACSALLAALLGRARSGRGGWIDQPLAGGSLPFLTLPIAEAVGGESGFVGSFLGGACASYRLYNCGDGAPIAVGAMETKFWVGFVELLGLPELRDRGLESGESGREVAARVQQALASRPRAAWLEACGARGLPVSAVNDLAEARSELRSAGWIEETPVPGGGRLPLPAPWLRSIGAAPSRPAPRLGEQTSAVFAEFGLPA